MIYTEVHKAYATARQLDYIKAVEKHGSNNKAAKALGVGRRSVDISLKRLVARVARQGHSPDHDMTHTTPDGFHIKGVSTNYGADGQIKQQWVKTNIDRERQNELIQEAIHELSRDLPKLKPVKTLKSKAYSKDIMAVYPLGDPHIGMLSWGEETGQDWDLDLAEKAFGGVFDRLIKTSPQCEQCTIVNLGDYFHYDNMDGVTSRSGHSLDVDSRFGRMVKVGVRIMRRMITAALEHHKAVHVINATGNHDDTSSIFLNIALANIYENEPRVTIDDKSTPIHYMQFGKSAFGVHHGHSIKMQALPAVMAADEPKMWGDTEYRYFYTGHIHHDSMKEYPGCKVESFRTLAAKDAYAAWGGYRSLQDSKCIVLHREYGEVERHTVNLNMI